MTDAKILSDKDYVEIDELATLAVENALKFADESHLPDEKELFTDVYA